MAGLVRWGGHINSFKVSFIRFVIGLSLVGTAALLGKIKLKFVHGPLLFLRGLFGGAAVFLLYLSIAKLGVGVGTVISYSYPIFASVFGAIILRERIGIKKALFIFIAFIGMYVLTVKEQPLSLGFSIGRYELLALLGSICSGIAVVLVKKLHDTDSTYAIFFAQCAIGLWLMVVPANVSADSIGYSGGLLLLAIGITAAIGQLLMTEGFRHVSVTTGSLLALLVPVLNFVVGIAVFDEKFSVRGIVGAVVVVISCAAVIVTGETDNESSPQVKC